MAKALGATPEEEHRMGISKLAKQIQGQVGLFFTDSKPDEVIEWFADFQQPDFARAGNVAGKKLILKLTSEQAQLLKLIGEKMVTFRVSLTCRWEAATGDVVQIEGQPLPDNSGDAEESDDEMDE
ncbi:Ribosome assembly factor mrt4 [Mycena indigotica]|uniref:Ribosome assembly factor mrt4 n=1 Tax=Mycena indigotica TaxID=2126181 RepID=A0A8H6SWE3_9AGAR|nr:Ribosome assembly factor mrt4 [Mycena indigotica]KAF7306518.1 Ribosome assembly factor mrt4 [Mycena indigotica]